MESKSVVVTGYCVTQISSGLLFVPFGGTEYRCNWSRVRPGWPARSLLPGPCFEAHFLWFIPDLRSILCHAVCVFCSLAQRAAPNLQR